MFANRRTWADKLDPLVHLACFLIMGSVLFVVGMPWLRDVLGSDFLDFLSDLSQR